MRIVLVLVMIMIAALSVNAPAVQAQEPIIGYTCDGNLVVTIDLTNFGEGGKTAFITGKAGTNLPTESKYWEDGKPPLVFVIPGPGKWPALWISFELVGGQAGAFFPGHRITSVDCVPKGEAIEETPLPGCDVLIALPEQAVGGTFLETFVAFYDPGKITAPEVVIPGGTHAWILGMDESGEYTKFLWSCEYLWAPTGLVGPSYDPPWNGWPLPTEIVE